MMRISGTFWRRSVLLVALAGCGGSDGPSDPGQPGAPVASATVVAGATSETFTPARVDLLRNGTVTWTFGALVHNVTFASASAPASIPDATNTQVTRSFPNAGTFDYSCTIHPGMTGRVVVQ